MSDRTDTRSRRLHGLDGLRGVAGLGVVLVHVWMYTGARDPRAPRLVDAVIGELRLGVVAFFVLSAYLLVRPWLRAARGHAPPPRVGAFLFRRAARIMPAWWLAIAGAFAILWRTGSGRGSPPQDLPIFAFMAQNHFARTRDHLIPPGWSLAVEITFYLLLPLLGWLVIRSARRRSSGAAVAAVAAALVGMGLAFGVGAWHGHWAPTVTASLPLYLPIFACGIVAAALPVPRRRAGRWALLAAGWALVVACGVWHAHGTGMVGHVVRDLPAAAGFALIVPVLATGGGGLLDLPPIRWFGTVSYGTYLWHMPVLFALWTSGWLPDIVPLAYLAVLAPTLALASLSWYGLERPVLLWSERRLRRGRAPSARRRLQPQTVP